MYEEKNQRYWDKSKAEYTYLLRLFVDETNNLFVEPFLNELDYYCYYQNNIFLRLCFNKNYLFYKINLLDLKR